MFIILCEKINGVWPWLIIYIKQIFFISHRITKPPHIFFQKSVKIIKMGGFTTQIFNSFNIFAK